jgi:hypothetical protein
MARNISAIILYDKNKKILLQHRAEDAERETTRTTAKRTDETGEST